jgi:hypothetical protein
VEGNRDFLKKVQFAPCRGLRAVPARRSAGFEV